MTFREKVEVAILRDLRSVKGKLSITYPDGTRGEVARTTIAKRASEVAAQMWGPIVGDLLDLARRAPMCDEPECTLCPAIKETIARAREALDG